MRTVRADRREFVVRLGPEEVAQRIVRIDRRARFFPPPDHLFDLWHAGRPWGAVLREEPHWARPGRIRRVECGELTAGLRWQVGAELRFSLVDGRVEVAGDLEP